MAVYKSAEHFAVNAAENLRLKSPWMIHQHKRQVYYSMPSEKRPQGTVERTSEPDGLKQIRVFSRTAEDIAKTLRDETATFVSARPSIIMSILENAENYQFLKLIVTLTEALPDEFQLALAKVPGCRNLDTYGSVETGLIAMKCPRCGL